MKCQGNPELVSAFIDGELSDEEAAQASEHIDSCPACGRLRDEYIRIGEWIAEEEAEVPEGFTAAVMEKISAREASHRKGRVKRYGSLAAICAIVIIAGVAVGIFSSRSGSSKSTGTAADMAAAETYDTAEADERSKAMSGGGSDEYGYMNGSEAAGDSGDAATLAPEQSYGTAGSTVDTAAPQVMDTATDDASASDGKTGGSDSGTSGQLNSSQTMAGFATVPSETAEEAATAGNFKLSVQVDDLTLVVKAMEKAGSDYYLYQSDDGKSNLVMGLADYETLVSATSNVLSEVKDDSADGQWVLLSEN